jgi:hypothetical protein
MMRMLLGCLVTMLGLARGATMDDIASVPWTEAHVDELRRFDGRAVEDFVNRFRGGPGMHVTVGEFAWVDLAGDGQYQLVVTLDLSGRAYFDYVAIYRRSRTGKVRRQWIEGQDVKLGRAIRDLDGDGTKELILLSGIDSGDPRGFAWGPSRVWPKVYRLRSGSYVDGSAAFATYYDQEVLPPLEKEIDEARQSAAREQVPPENAEWTARKLMVLELTRDKILGVLGRKPTNR